MVKDSKELEEQGATNEAEKYVFFSNWTELEEQITHKSLLLLLKKKTKKKKKKPCKVPQLGKG